VDPNAQLPAPVTASIPRRLTGWLIDYLIVLVPGTALVGLAVVTLVHQLPSYVGTVAADVGWSRLMGLITHHGAEAGAVTGTASREWFDVARPLLGAILAVPLIQLAYQAGLLSWRGRTIGKLVTDTRVDAVRAGVSPRRRRLAVRRALGTTVVETGLVGVAVALAIIGHLYLGAILWLVAVIAFWANAFTAFGPRRRSLVDRLAGTVVVRTRLYAQVAERGIDVGRRISDAALAARDQGSGLPAAAGHRAVAAAGAAGRMTSDAAAVAGRLAREGAAAIPRSAPVQQALNSRAGQQAQALGAAGADRARQLGTQAGRGARLLRGRAGQLWQERQSQRVQQPPDEPDGPHRRVSGP